MNPSGIYKRGQAANTRLGTAFGIFIVVAYGCFVLNQKLAPTGNIWLQTLVPIGLCAVFSGVIAWVMNRPSVADFLIASEGEVKKVSWSTRKELTASTTVVIFVMLSIAILLAVVDFLFVWFFQKIGLY
jgi:preprotein translocase subunit SecE